MSKLYAIERSDGGVSIMHLLEQGANLQRELAAWEQATGMKAQAAHEVTSDQIPTDRTFRGAWSVAPASGQTPPRVVVDMPKAREIHLDRIRAARDQKLRELDVAYMQADESGDQEAKATIAQQKQALRDLPQTIDLEAVSTPEALAEFWPAQLRDTPADEKGGGRDVTPPRGPDPATPARMP